MTIDVTKPLQLTDGTPVEFVEIDDRLYNTILVRYPDGDTWHHKLNGEWYGDSSKPYLQNVPEVQPAVDFTKPVQTRDGRKVTIVATGVMEDLPGYHPRHPSQSVAYRIAGSSDMHYAHDDGSYLCRGDTDVNDIINVPEEPERTSEFRGFNSKGQGGQLGNMYLGGYPFESLAEAQAISFINGEAILELIREGDRLVDVKFHPKDA